eukprot:jgi/Chrzof1/9264/UNPLg00231.t1
MSGNIVAGGYIQQCDQRIKSSISDLAAQQSLDVIMKLRPRTYIQDGVHRVGFVAQEVAPALPEAITVRPGRGYADFNYLDYSSIMPHVVGALQALCARMHDGNRAK